MEARHWENARCNPGRPEQGMSGQHILSIDRPGRKIVLMAEKGEEQAAMTARLSTHRNPYRFQRLVKEQRR